jgi:hypothetical protein
MGRRKMDGNYSPPQNSKGNEENGYPLSDFNKTKINDTKEPSNAHKKQP